MNKKPGLVVATAMLVGGALSIPLTGPIGIVLAVIGLVALSVIGAYEEPPKGSFKEGAGRRKRLADGTYKWVGKR